MMGIVWVTRCRDPISELPWASITSGASAPEELVQRLIGFFRARGTERVEEFEVLREDVRFMLPKVIRQAVAARRA